MSIPFNMSLLCKSLPQVASFIPLNNVFFFTEKCFYAVIKSVCSHRNQQIKDLVFQTMANGVEYSR